MTKMFLLLLLLSIRSYAGTPGTVDIISHRLVEKDHSDCAATQSCTLISASMDLTDYAAHFQDGDSFGTKVHISYKTNSISTLEDYVVVQFIRGCQFSSAMKNGEISYSHTIMRDSFGKTVPFIHPDWQIDSVDTDPVYNSLTDKGLPRHHLYRWNEKAGSFDQKTQHYFSEKKPPRPVLYVRDTPSTAFAMPFSDDLTMAQNISLEFRSCIYKNKDVPETVSSPADMLENIQPLICFEWASSYIYDFKKGVFRHPSEISAQCK